MKNISNKMINKYIDLLNKIIIIYFECKFTIENI